MRTINNPIIEQISAAARGSTAEICGALIGDANGVSSVVALENRSEQAYNSFFIPARDVLHIEQEAERSGHMLLGFYHSHPTGDAVPSDADLQDALPGYVYWIASRTGVVRAWTLRDDRSTFDEIEIRTHGDR